MSSEERLKPQQIAERLRCSDLTVQRAMHAFETEGVACLEAKPRASHDDQRTFDDEARERLKGLVRWSPREFGYAASLWTLEKLIEVSVEEGLIDRQVSIETMSQTLKEVGINWQRAKHWINSPDEQYPSKETMRLVEGSGRISRRLAVVRPGRVLVFSLCPANRSCLGHSRPTASSGAT